MPSIASVQILKVENGLSSSRPDQLAIEEPLEISLVYGSKAERIIKNISVTMRTPGQDLELARGFLFTEGIIQKNTDVQINSSGDTVLAVLPEHVRPDLKKLERHFYTSSSCGVCGKASVEAVRTVNSAEKQLTETLGRWQVDAEMICQLPDKLRRQQEVFASTGGLHASALFDREGNLLLLREDVGRHNALDKLIGAALADQRIPLQEHILLLSGRASFELVQKAVMAGIPIIAAVGAPSSLAVELAKEFQVTLIGFLRNQRFNIYSHPERIILR